MKSVRERDLLIAQTMAFVQSLTGSRKPETEPAPIKADLIKERAADEVELPVELRSNPLPDSELRAEIRARIAVFRAHQQRFDREREDYFNSVLTRARSPVATGPSMPPS